MMKVCPTLSLGERKGLGTKQVFHGRLEYNGAYQLENLVWGVCYLEYYLDGDCQVAIKTAMKTDHFLVSCINPKLRATLSGS